MKQKKEYLKEYIDILDNDKIEFLYSLFHLYQFDDKDKIINLFDSDKVIDTNKVDSAYPIDYYRRIEEIYPDLKNGWYIFDYTKENFGSLVNLNNVIAKKILCFFSNII